VLKIKEGAETGMRPLVAEGKNEEERMLRPSV